MADDFFTRQLPHNVTWGLTVLYALDASDNLADLKLQARTTEPGSLCWSIPCQHARRKEPLVAAPKGMETSRMFCDQ